MARLLSGLRTPVRLLPPVCPPYSAQLSVRRRNLHVRIYDSDRYIIEVGEDMKVVCRRFLDSGMTPEEGAKRLDVPMKFINACMRG